MLCGKIIASMRENLKYQIAFVDIDWTILDHNIGDWDYPSLEALKTAQKEGMLIYLCTARPYDSVFDTGILDIFHPDGIICTNGGVAFINGKLLFANIIPEDIVYQIEKVMHRHHLVAELATNTDRYFTAKPNEYVRRYFKVYREIMPDIRKYQNKEVSAILLFAPEKYDERLIKEFPKEINYLRFDDHGVDVGYYQNTKGDGIKRVLKYLNIDKESSIGIGDSNDDISMFNETGLSAAMGNGSDQAKAMAKQVIPPISEHGVKQLFDQIMSITAH